MKIKTKRYMKELGNNDAADGINLVKYFQEIKRLKWVFVAAFVVIMGLAIAAVSIKQSQTEVHGALLVEDDEGQNSGAMKGGLGSLMRTFSIGGIGSASMDNELPILASNNNMCRVVRSLGLNYLYVEKSGLKKHTLYNETPVRVAFDAAVIDTLSRAYNVVVKIKESGKVDITASRSKMMVFSKTYAELHDVDLPATLKLPEGNATVLKTKEFDAFKGSTVSVRCLSTRASARYFATMIEFNQIGNKSDAIQIDLLTPNTDMGCDIIDALMTEYNELRFTHKVEKARSEVDFLDQEIAKITTELNASEAKVEKFSTDNNLYASGEETAMLWGKDTRLKDELVQHQSRIATYDMALNILKNGKDTYATLPETLGGDESSLAGQYNALLVQRRTLARSAKDSNLAMQELDLQIETLRKMAIEKIEQRKKIQQLAMDNVLAKNRKDVGRLGNMPGYQRQLTDLLRDRELKNELYMFLFEKRTSSALKMASKSALGFVFEPAYADLKPSMKKPLIILALGFIMSIFLPMALVVYNVNFKSAKPIEEDA